MDPFGFVFAVAVFGAVGFVMGRNYQRNGRVVPDEIRRFVVESSRPLPLKIRGMGDLLLAVFALVMSFFFLALTTTVQGGGPGGFLAALCFMAYWLLVPIWVYRDAKSRGERAWAWGLMTLFTNVLGLFSYLITRPEKPRTCQRCGYHLREEFVVCPFCGPQAGRTCGNCQSAVEPEWIYCPFCQAPIANDDGSAFAAASAGHERLPPPSGVSDLPIASS